MQLSKMISTGMVALTAVAAFTPATMAHNLAKYTGIPFVVAGYCPNVDPGVSARWVTVNGQLQLRVVADGSAWSGFEVFCSTPTSGTLPATTTGSFPEGILTFNVSGLPAGGIVVGPIYYSAGAPGGDIFFGNGIATFHANAPAVPGANVVSIVIFVGNGSSTPTGVYSTVTLSNFRYNNSPLLIDTTQSDTSVATGTLANNYCFD